MNVIIALSDSSDRPTQSDLTLSLVRRIRLMCPADKIKTDRFDSRETNESKRKRAEFYLALNSRLFVGLSFSDEPKSLRGGRVFAKDDCDVSSMLARLGTMNLRRAGLMMLPHATASRDDGHSFLSFFRGYAIDVVLGNRNNRSDICEVGDGEDVAYAIVRLIDCVRRMRLKTA